MCSNYLRLNIKSVDMWTRNKLSYTLYLYMNKEICFISILLPFHLGRVIEIHGDIFVSLWVSRTCITDDFFKIADHSSRHGTGHSSQLPAMSTSAVAAIATAIKRFARLVLAKRAVLRRCFR